MSTIVAPARAGVVKAWARDRTSVVLVGRLVKGVTVTSDSDDLRRLAPGIDLVRR